MDSKISDFFAATTLNASDIIPIVTANTNKKISAGVFSLNLPNFGNKGITKNVVQSSTDNALPLLYTLLSLPVSISPYTLSNGADGQEITVVSLGTNILTVTNAWVNRIDMVAGSSVTLIFVGNATKWVVKCSNGCVFI